MEFFRRIRERSFMAVVFLSLGGGEMEGGKEEGRRREEI